MMRFVSLTLALVLTTCAVYAEEWPGWRGPRGDGTSAEKNVPLKFGGNDNGENLRWKTEIPGKGHSSPVVWGDRVFVTSCIENEQKRVLYCLDRADGKILWERVVLTSKLERKHPLNSYASSTPATDGKYVYVTFLETPSTPANAAPQMKVYCYDFDGEKVWEQTPGKLTSQHGFCSPPILHKDLVILNGDQDNVPDPKNHGYLVALDKKTGDEKWRTERPNQTRSYCAPLLIQSAKNPKVTQLVLSGSKCVAGYDADTGKQLWIIDGPTEQYVASLVYLDNILFLTAGFPTYHLMGISPDGEGDVTKTAVLWHHAKVDPKKASYVPSPIAFDGHFFVVSDAGYLNCLEAKTGRLLWTEKLGRHHSASPVLADGRFYFPDDNGNVWVVKASDKFEVLQKNELGEECYSSPAVSHGQIFIRGLNHLFCFGAADK
jgi:outer membrane protein assembly factor BamB